MERVLDRLALPYVPVGLPHESAVKQTQTDDDLLQLANLHRSAWPRVTYLALDLTGAEPAPTPAQPVAAEAEVDFTDSIAFDLEGLSLSAGAACSSGKVGASHVLTAMGVLTHGNVRATLPWDPVATDRAEGVERLIAELPVVIADVRAHLGAGEL